MRLGRSVIFERAAPVPIHARPLASARAPTQGRQPAGPLLVAPRQAPKAFGKVNARHVPANAITFSAALMLIGVGLNYVVPEEVFVWVTSVALVGSLWT
jgi:L-asparagine transporter-like permease